MLGRTYGFKAIEIRHIFAFFGHYDIGLVDRVVGITVVVRGAVVLVLML